MSISITTRQAYSEIDEFLNLLNEEQRNKLPEKLRNFFSEEKDNEYHKSIDANIPIKDQNLKEETLAIIAMLNLQYWCKDEKEKKRLQAIYDGNESNYQKKLYEKYNPNDIFKSKQDDSKLEENTQIINYKESIFKKIINRILNFLHIK